MVDAGLPDQLPRGHFGGSWVPLEEAAIATMLRLGGCSREDTVLEIGCGDGRVLEYAAAAFKPRRVVGVEIDRDLAAAAAKRCSALDVQVEVIQGDGGDVGVLRRAGLSSATLIVLFMEEMFLGDTLMPILQSAEVRPGTRVCAATHAFPSTWPPVASEVVTLSGRGAATRRTIRKWVTAEPPALPGQPHGSTALGTCLSDKRSG